MRRGMPGTHDPQFPLTPKHGFALVCAGRNWVQRTSFKNSDSNARLASHKRGYYMAEHKTNTTWFRKKMAGAPISLSDFFPKTRRMLSHIYPELYPYRRIFLGAWLLLAVLSMVSASPIILAKKIIDDFPDGASRFVLSLSLMAVAIILIRILEIAGTLIIGMINFKLRHALELTFAKRLAAMPLSYYENNASGKLSVTPFTQIPLVTRFIEILLRNILQGGMTVLAIVVVLFSLNLSVGLLAFLLVPFFFLGIQKLGKKIQNNMVHVFGQLSSLHSSLLENLVAVKSIRTLGITDDRVRGISTIIQDTFKTETKTLLLTGRHQLILEFVFATGAVSLVYLLREQFIHGHITLATCTALLTGFGLLCRETKKMAGGIMELRRIIGASTDIFNFLEHQVIKQDGPTVAPPKQIDDIRIENVYFSYNKKAPVLKAINMVFKKGQVTGILGESGAGKTTLADLLLRLREPDSGKILLNGQDFAHYDEAWIRNHFGFADQEPFLFNTTVRNNLLLAAPDLPDEQIVRSLDASSALDFVSRFPEGIDTWVGEGGSLLSVGQKQRIVLARVLLKKPQVLILDEITSALDMENEEIVLKALKQLSLNIITIIVTHKDSVASICDRHYMIKSGQVSEL